MALALYAEAPADLARELSLIDADSTTANVVIAAPHDRRIVALPDAEAPLARVALVPADLLTLPNRSDAEAEQLIGPLARGNAAWNE